MFEQDVHDFYSVIESVAFYNYSETLRSPLEISHRYGEEECCCCGQPRRSCLIICEDCDEIWNKTSRIDGDAHDAMIRRIRDWIDEGEYYSFERFLIVCSAELDRIFPERKNKDVSNLIRCLREIERKKLVEFDSGIIDDLINSVSQRWNILEVS